MKTELFSKGLEIVAATDGEFAVFRVRSEREGVLDNPTSVLDGVFPCEMVVLGTPVCTNDNGVVSFETVVELPAAALVVLVGVVAPGAEEVPVVEAVVDLCRRRLARDVILERRTSLRIEEEAACENTLDGSEQRASGVSYVLANLVADLKFLRVVLQLVGANGAEREPARYSGGIIVP